jgi:hypothetical protein
VRAQAELITGLIPLNVIEKQKHTGAEQSSAASQTE